jgi:hypothetical protein
MKDTMADHAIPGLGPGHYGEWRTADIGVITDRLEQALILELAGNLAGLRALDVGCGDGELALELGSGAPRSPTSDFTVMSGARHARRSEARRGKVTAVSRELGELLGVATIAVLTQGC